MKRYVDKNEIAALFFIHYFKYTRFAFKKQKSDTDKASINAHRALMRLFGTLYREKERVLISELITDIKGYIVPTQSDYVKTFASVMEEAIVFIYDNVLREEREQRLLDRYA